tara:strand:+ start:679 stop:1074 length:396 start_codon:yes stop_codon:yes gene_type:complete
MPANGLITFDFDDTLTVPFKDKEGFWVSGGYDPNLDTIATMQALAEQGHEIAIVTSRPFTQGSKEKITIFIMEHELPVERDVVFTNGEWKADFLLKLGSTCHYDDSPDELIRIQEKGIAVVEVKHPPGPRR